SKKMPDADRNKFRAAVAEQLTSVKIGTFVEDVALKLDLATTSKNAPQAHTIAKNLLDLLGRPPPGVKAPERRTLYEDDRQIQALSGHCRHGEAHPSIAVEARPFAAMLKDIELAAEAIRRAEMSTHALYREAREAEWMVDALRDLKKNEASSRRRLGDM